MNITMKSAWRLVLALAKIGDLSYTWTVATTTLPAAGAHAAATLRVETNSFQTAPRPLLFTLSNQQQPSGEISTLER